MVETKMPSPKKVASDSDIEKKPESSLKVTPDVQRMVSKLAAHRGKSILNLFNDKDIQDFFSHLLIEEMRKEEARLKGRK